MFFVIANPVVKRFSLPESLAGFSENLIRFTGCKSFPTLYDCAHCLIGHRPEDDVNMIGHDNPSIQSVTVAVKKPQCSGDQIRDLGSFEPTLSLVCIEKTLQVAKIIAFDFFDRIFRHAGSSLLLAGCRLIVEAVKSFRALCLIFQQHGLRQRIGKSERHEIARTFAFDVRKKTARVNTRPKRICRLRLDAGCAKFKFDAVNPRIIFVGKHRGMVGQKGG